VKFVKTKDKEKIEYLMLLLVTKEDVELYSKYYNEITSKKLVSSWFGFKSQSFRTTYHDWLAHERLNCPEANLAALKLRFVDEEIITIVDVCNIFDSIMNDKINGFYDIILNSENIVRLNNRGGYYPISIDDMNEYYDIIEITEENENLISRFILNGELRSNAISIDSDTIILENSSVIDEYFRHYVKDNVCSKESPYPYELTNLKQQLMCHSNEEIFNIFDKAVLKGLKNICFQTTGQDLHFAKSLISILDMLIKKNKDFIAINCFNQNSKIIFQLTNGKIITLVHSNFEVCSELKYDNDLKDNIRFITGYFYFTESNYEELKNSPISLMRIQFMGENKDYIIISEFESELLKTKSNPSRYFVDYLNCVE
jgi:hypothetical protein